MYSRARFVGLCVGVFAAALTAATAGAGVSASTSGAGAAARERVDLVYISDSSGWGVAGVYGRMVGKALGATVRVHDEWQPNLSAAAILDDLQQGGRLAQLVRSAEAIVVYGNPAGLEIVKGGDCVTSSVPPRVVGPRSWVKYVAAVKEIYKRIFQLRQGEPVILRTANWYVPVIAQGQPSWQEAGIAGICTKKWGSFAAAISKAAAAYRVPVADVYTAFNGRNHRQDPVAKGYIQSDGIHPNSKGRIVIATTLASLGYKPVTQPG